ncbi:MAG: MBL fold metallo-hydrolase [Cyclobacteriaceae bacterium]|nr:MBL fold metallo-hydrolase [Cyclobacteriaceae bacterium]
MIRKIGKILLISVISFSLIVILFMQQKSFGNLPKGGRKQRLEASPNYKDGGFQNRRETPMMAEDVSYVSLLWKFLKSDSIRYPQQTLPSVRTDLKNLPSEKPSIVWFGHSTYLITLNNKHILVDPVFSERASPVQYAGSKAFEGTMIYSLSDFPAIDMVVISHDHYDHLDYNTILKLKSSVKRFSVPLGVGQHLVTWGVDESAITEFDWWDQAEIFPGMQLTSTPARHFSGRGFVRNKTLWSSYVLQTNEYKIFIGGDSGYDDAFKEIGNKYGPFDLALLECGQYDRQWPNIHMMPEQTVQAGVDLNAKVMMPVHWGKFVLANHPWKEPVERATKQAEVLKIKIATPLIGEPIFLNDSFPAAHWWQGLK